MRSVLMEKKTSKQFKCSVCSSFFASEKAAKRHEKLKKNHTYVQNFDFVNEDVGTFIELESCMSKQFSFQDMKLNSNVSNEILKLLCHKQLL